MAACNLWILPLPACEQPLLLHCWPLSRQLVSGIPANTGWWDFPPFARWLCLFSISHHSDDSIRKATPSFLSFSITGVTNVCSFGGTLKGKGLGRGNPEQRLWCVLRSRADSESSPGLPWSEGLRDLQRLWGLLPTCGVWSCGWVVSQGPTRFWHLLLAEMLTVPAGNEVE